MLRHLISVTYFYIYFNQFRNVLECYEETTVRQPAAATHTHTHTQLFTPTVTTKSSYLYEIKISYRSIQPCYFTTKLLYNYLKL